MTDFPSVATRVEERPGVELKEPSALARHLIMPVLLGGALLALYFYISGLELDSIEQRVLNWPNIHQALLRHLWISGAAAAGIVGIAVPLGIVLTRRWARGLTPMALSVANAGQAIPSLGLLALLTVLAFVWAGFPVRSSVNIAILALIIYGLLPVLRNTMVGIQQVDPAEIESGRGMGMTAWQVLWRIELPLAVPVILAGIRVSLILAVGTATIAFTIGAGGLGLIIAQGISLNRSSVLITGAVITAVLALTVDWLAGVIEHIFRPKGL